MVQSRHPGTKGRVGRSEDRAREKDLKEVFETRKIISLIIISLLPKFSLPKFIQIHSSNMLKSLYLAL